MTNDLPWDPSSPDFVEQELLYEEEGSTLLPLTSERDILSVSTILCRNVNALCSNPRKLSSSDERVACLFNCSMTTAAKTRQVTTQKGIHSFTGHLTRHFRTKQATLRYDQLGGRHGRFYSDTFFSAVKSIRGNTMGQLFANDVGFYHFVPMKLKGDAGDALLEFIQEVGIPGALHTDDAKELTSGKWEKVRKDHGIKQTLAEPYSPFQNCTEVNIRELKKHVRHLMGRTKTPKRLWDFCSRYVSEVRSLTAQPLFSLHGSTPFELVTGNTPDISEYLAFEWYQPVYYYDQITFPNQRKLLGRWIGVAHNVGQAMCFWILPRSGVPIARTTVRAVTEAELQTNDVKMELESFDASIKRKIGDHLINESDLSFEVDSNKLLMALQDASDDDDGHYDMVEPEADRQDVDEYDEETYDKLLSAEVALPKGDFQFIGKVIGRK
jgi:hypothetical protein